MTLFKEIFYNFLEYNKLILIYVNHLTKYKFLVFIAKILSIAFEVKVVAITYGLVCIWYYFKFKKFGYNTKIHSDLFQFGVFFLMACIVGCSKWVLKFPRPYCSITDISTPILIKDTECLLSFPSGHTILSTIFAFAVLRRHKLAAFTLILLTMASRIMLGLHYPSDTIYSFIIAIIIIYSGKKIMPYLEPLQRMIMNFIAKSL